MERTRWTGGRAPTRGLTTVVPRECVSQIVRVRYLALATDYDGTLAEQGTVRPQSIAAVERLRKSGRRAVLVTGAGRGFSSGADLKAGFDPAEDGMPDIKKELHEIYHPAIAGIRHAADRSVTGSWRT